MASPIAIKSSETLTTLKDPFYAIGEHRFGKYKVEIDKKVWYGNKQEEEGV